MTDMDEFTQAYRQGTGGMHGIDTQNVIVSELSEDHDIYVAPPSHLDTSLADAFPSKESVERSKRVKPVEDVITTMVKRVKKAKKEDEDTEEDTGKVIVKRTPGVREKSLIGGDEVYAAGASPVATLREKPTTAPFVVLSKARPISGGHDNSTASYIYYLNLFCKSVRARDPLRPLIVLLQITPIRIGLYYDAMKLLQMTSQGEVLILLKEGAHGNPLRNHKGAYVDIVHRSVHLWHTGTCVTGGTHGCKAMTVSRVVSVVHSREHMPYPIIPAALYDIVEEIFYESKWIEFEAREIREGWEQVRVKDGEIIKL